MQLVSYGINNSYVNRLHKILWRSSPQVKYFAREHKLLSLIIIKTQLNLVITLQRKIHSFARFLHVHKGLDKAFK